MGSCQKHPEGGGPDFLGGTVHFDQNRGGGVEMNFSHNGGGDNIVSLGLGGVTNFTQAILEVGGGHRSQKNFRAARAFFLRFYSFFPI